MIKDPGCGIEARSKKPHLKEEDFVFYCAEKSFVIFLYFLFSIF